MSAPADDSPRDTRATTDFGFRRVPEADKSSLVRGVFDSVANRYDLMNDLMSGGVHRLWKATMVDALHPRQDMTLVDVGGGTGDIARQWRSQGGGPVAICDVNRAMLAVGQSRSETEGEAITWVCGDAERLPFEDRTFDVYATAFCLRNVTRLADALAEARRVLKPGGRFVCLEFSRVVVPGLDRLYDAYSFTVLPKLGRWVAGDADSYRYLAESIRRFPAQRPFAKMIAAAGFGRVSVRNLSGGIVALHGAWRT